MIAERLHLAIDRIGFPGTLTRTAPPGPPPSGEWPLKLAIRHFGLSELGGVIQQGDVEATIAATALPPSVRPTLSDRIVVDGRSWLVVDRPTPLFSGLTVVAWRLHLRGG
jgi:hypothetical protein